MKLARGAPRKRVPTMGKQTQSLRRRIIFFVPTHPIARHMRAPVAIREIVVAVRQSRK